MELFIKNMVCPRCIKRVGEILESLGLKLVEISLGHVTIENSISLEQRKILNDHLTLDGFELIEDPKRKWVASIKTYLIELLEDELISNENFKLSSYLAEKLEVDYQKLSQVFSDIESLTIEKFFITLKVEKVKEWLSYGDYSLSEIAYKLGYSSVNHLSNQFKQQTGYTATEFKKLKTKPRKGLAI